MFSRILIIVIMICMFDFINAAESKSYGSNYTHPAITLLAVDGLIRDGSLERFLKNDIDLQSGLKTQFNLYPEFSSADMKKQIERNNDVIGKEFRRQYTTLLGNTYSAKYLMTAGSEAEDHPTERAQHHFHNPLSDTGLDNNYYGVGVFADFLALLYPPAEQGNAGRLICSLVSLCEPGFNLDGTSAVERVTGKTSADYPHNYFAWPDTRQYYYNALSAKTKEEREYNFALTFFSLGHSLHLLEDMAVPAHTRNDFLYDHIWHGVIHGAYLEGFVEDGRRVGDVPTMQDRISFNKLADFWDNNGSLEVEGLAEYSNYNFMSEGTVFKKYDNPEWINIVRSEITAEDGISDVVEYYTGVTTDGIDITHLAAVGLLNPLFDFMSDRERAGYTAFLDPNCYKDYADILIPKAAAYVSGLTEYFFRGRMAVIRDYPDGIRIKNLSAEPLTEGIIEVYYDSSTTGERTILSSYVISPDSPVDSGGMTERISLNAPADNEEKGRYIVIFKGRLGEEDGAVIGKVYRERLLFVSERRGVPEIYSMSQDGNSLKVMVSNTDPDITFTHPAGSPDGARIAFHSNIDNREGIWILDLSSGSMDRFADGYWPSWSPDGKLLLYSKDTGDKKDIYVFNMDTHEETRLTDDSFNNLWPSWSPDGSEIAYTSQRENKSDIIIIDLKSGLMRNLTASLDSRDRWKPSWSPDGARIAYEKPTKIVYAIDEPWYVNVCIVDLNNDEESCVTNSDITNTDHGVWNGPPVWMDDDRIIIESNISGDGWSDLWVVDAGGNGFITRLTDTQGHDGYPFVW